MFFVFSFHGSSFLNVMICCISFELFGKKLGNYLVVLVLPPPLYIYILHFTAFTAVTPNSHYLSHACCHKCNVIISPLCKTTVHHARQTTLLVMVTNHLKWLSQGHRSFQQQQAAVIFKGNNMAVKGRWDLTLKYIFWIRTVVGTCIYSAGAKRQKTQTSLKLFSFRFGRLQFKWSVWKSIIYPDVDVILVCGSLHTLWKQNCVK